MSTTLYRVVFRGEISEGQDKEQVMQRVKALCKYDDATLAKFFSGKPCIIKDRVDPQQAQKYKSALEKTGAICYVLKTPSTNSCTIQTQKTVAPPPPVKSMTCPKCSFDQPEGTLCAQCGINIARYQQRQLTEQEQMFPTAEESHSGSESSTNVTITQLLLSPEGRVNRQKYILINLAMGLITIPANFVLIHMSVLAYLVAILAVSYVSLILSIKRAHDRDMSGHFCWLMFIPIVGLWPWFVFTFLKGTDGSNRFGPDPLRA